MDEKLSIEMESQQLPSSSTEEVNEIAKTSEATGTDKNKAMAEDAIVDEALTYTQCASNNKKNDEKDENVDCAADSSGVINKCDLTATTIDDAESATDQMTVVDSAPVLKEPTIKIIELEFDNQSEPEIANVIQNIQFENKTETEIDTDNVIETNVAIISEAAFSSEPKNNSKHESNSVGRAATEREPEPEPEPEAEPEQKPKQETDVCNASSSSSKSDINCVDENCDSVESATKEDVEQLSNVQNDKIIVANVDCGAKTGQLDSKIEQIDDNNDSVDEQQTTKNGSNDCDSSDILVENKVESEENGAISANYVCDEKDRNESNDTTDKCETIAEPIDVKRPEMSKNENENENANAKEAEQNLVEKESTQSNVQTEQTEQNKQSEQNEQLPSDSPTEETDVQTQMDIDPETMAKEANEQTACEIASAGDTKQNCNDSTPRETSSNIEMKCAYDLNECVLSPEIAPIGFKDKFKKSLEIMEKSKQESNSIDKIAKMNDQVKIDEYHKSSQQQTNASHDNDIESFKDIRNDENDSQTNTSTCHQNANETASSSNNVCNSMEEKVKMTKMVTINTESTAKCIPTESKFVSNDNAIIPGASITHSTLENSEQRQRECQERKMKPTIASETRTIIISPQNKDRLDAIKSKNDDPNSAFGADLLSSKSGSLYINNPDFSKSMRPSLRDLSGLKMKTPDFSKIARSSELHVPNPDFTKAYDKHDPNASRSPLPSEVNPSNFAEISKKYNYISDLQLKNPQPTTSKINEPTQSTCSSLYVKTPDFTSKLQNQAENESEVAEEPTPHIIHKNMYRPHADSSSKTSATARSTTAHTDYPQISEDVTMLLVQHASQTKVSQTKPSAPSKPPTPLHRIESRAASNAPNASNASSIPPHAYSPKPIERPNSQNYYPHAVHQAEKSMQNMQKLYNEELYQRNLAVSPAHHQYASPAHVFQHRDVQPALVPNPSNQKLLPNHHAYEQYSTEKAPMPPKSGHPSSEVNVHRLPSDAAMYARPASTNMMYHEQNRLKPIHSAAQEVQSSSSGHMNTYSYSTGRPASAHNLNKPADYYNQMNPPQKWSNQTRITQSPISTALSPHSISSQNTRISQSQSPVGASPLPYQMHRQSPSNLQYHSPHTTPSPSPFGYSPSPIPVQPNKLPSNMPANNNPLQSK